MRTFGGEDQEREKFFRAVKNNRNTELKMVKVRTISGGLIQCVVAGALAITVFLVNSPQQAQPLSAGGFVSILAAMLAMLRPMKDLSAVAGKLQRGIAGAHSIFEVLDEVAEPDHGSKKLHRVQGRLEFQDVSFSYPGHTRKVLSQINVVFPANTTVALVGRSGSGKTSLAHLIPRFYEPTQGKILLDGIPLQDFTLESLREQIALVSQSVVLFNDTVANNIAYGSVRAADKSAIRRAAEMANAWEFIEKLPQGLETQVGEHGIMLSGGQRQRVAIARALLKNAPIVVLDEATSALDAESERAIQQALHTLSQGRTTVIIAHRLSTIEKADRIFVLDQGRIVESGRHQELLQKNGSYARLVAQQFAEEAMPC